jgi:hypothetical protein
MQALLAEHAWDWTAALQQTGEVTGGTGQFTAATGSFTSTVNGQRLAARNPDGSRAITQPALHEVDMIALSGTLSFSDDEAPQPGALRSARLVQPGG